MTDTPSKASPATCPSAGGVLPGTPSAPFVWTDERVRELMALVDEGLSYRSIGERMSLTKNQVYAKAQKVLWNGPNGRPRGSLYGLHPLIREFFEIVDEEGVLLYPFSKRVGYAPQTISGWRNRHRVPSVIALADCLKELGYELQIVERRAG